MKKRPLKTMIGSYPANFDRIGLVAIREAVNDQILAGLDLLSDGQTRTDMVSYFAKSIDGFKTAGDKPQIEERIGEPHPSIILKDFRLARLLLPEDKDIKGVVTGPVTLAFSSTIETSEYQGFRDERLYMDIAAALRSIAIALEKEGASYLQVDEPFFSVGVPMEIAKKAIEHIAEGVKVPVALHVCGEVTKVFPKLLDFQGIKILSHAFMGFQNNMKILDREALESHDKVLGLGCIDTKTQTIETAEAVSALVNRASEAVGWDRLIFHPDCGLRTLERPVALSKLKAMVQGVDMAWKSSH